jgi:Homeodomain-like domain
LELLCIKKNIGELMGKPQKYVVQLTSEERKMLFELLKKGRANREKLNRARILLKADCGEEGENWRDIDIAEALYIPILTVQRTRQSLVEEGLEKTLDRTVQKNRKKRIIQGEEEAYLVALVCGDPPTGHAKWTLRLLADKMVELEYVNAVSHETIRSALKKTKLSLGRKRSGVSLQEPMRNSFAKWKKS